ncbi:MAG: hypothetical protein HWQ38_07950, partial [Nostoc sp. NMS7]|uniref:hypothetical protein n=1 Tax=Nostoc sp. NMS7 TaxID=2815391 RepID=UPI0025CCDBA0
MLTIKDIAADPKLAIQAQQLLINLKLLSGVADGKVGVQTTSAYSQLLQITKSAELTPELLQLKSLPQPELDFYRGNFAFRIAFGQYKAWSVGWHK